MNDEKKQRGRPKTDTEPVMIRMHPDMISDIDAYRRTLDDLPTRPEAMRRILAGFLDSRKADQT